MQLSVFAFIHRPSLRMSSAGIRVHIPAFSKADAPETARRKRKTLACYTCQRRKVRCDRVQPACGRCRNAGQADSCFYDGRSAQPVSHPRPASKQDTGKRSPFVPSVGWSGSPALGGFTSTERRPRTLEGDQNVGTWQLHGAKMDSSSKHNGERPALQADVEEFLASKQQDSASPETAVFRGKNFRTQYYGSSNPTSIVAHFPELRSFMKDTIMQHTSLPRVQRELKASWVRWKAAKAAGLPLTDSELLHLVPDRDIVDRLVRFYFDTFETMYRILHAPSFWEEYRLFWEDRQAVKPAFIVLLLLTMATVSCVSGADSHKYIGDSALSRERAVLWIEASEWWLGRQSQKHVYVTIWQIRCLLLLAKQVNIVKKKRTWTVAGTLLREAMSAGFHRDPFLLAGKVTFFDKEMRRRLWTTITEMELLISIDRGMPSGSAMIPSDNETVLNIDDEDLPTEGGSTPVSKPWEEYTSSSFLHISSASFSLRVTLNSRVNDPSSPLQYEEVLDYEEMIMKELQRLPPRVEADENQDPGQKGMSAMARTLLDLQLRQFLILLHAPFARQKSNNPRNAVSRMVCLNAAASILDQYSQLTKSGDLLPLLLRQDCYRAALIICHNLYTSITIQNNLVLSSNSSLFIQYVEDALTMLEDRITLHGTGYTHYWYISAACALLRSTLSPAESTVQKQQAIDRVSRQYYRILGAQEDFLKAKEGILSIGLSKVNATEDQMQFSELPLLDGSMSQAAFLQTDPASDEFYFGDPAAWTFDNLWSIEQLV